MNKKYKYLTVVLLIVCSLIAFGRILANDFINFDDNIYITENNHIKSGINTESIKWAVTSSYASNWHPLTWLSHILDWQLFGANASGHHLVNLLLHIGSAILLFLFLNKTTGSLWPSAFVAALFTLHPLRVESVAWVSERKDVLSMFLGLAVLYTYALYVEKPKLSKYCLCLILFALGLLAKPMLVTLPFVLMLLDYWPLERWQKSYAAGNVPASESVSERSGKKKIKVNKGSSTNEKKVSVPLTNRAKIIRSLLWGKSPFIFLALVSCIVTIWAQSNGGAVASLEKLPFLERIMNAIVSYIAYLLKIFWPVNLAVFYPYEQFLPLWEVFGAASILLAISIAVIYFIKKAPFLFVGWFWYLGTLVSVIGLMQVGKQAMADRYTYLPSIGVGIMIVWSIVYLLPKVKLRKIIIIPAAIILAALTFLTWQQCGYWKNSVVLYDHVLKVTKNNDLAHYNLANELVKQKNIGEAITHYLEAIKINPYYSNAYSNLGAALAAQGKNEEAIAHYLAAIKINPNEEEPHSNLGVVLAAQGRNEEAIAHYLEAIKINPNYDDAHYNLANLFLKQGKIDRAIGHYLEAIKINPDNADAHCNLADVFVKQNKIDQAIEHFREAVRINPSSFASLNNLGVNLEKQLKHDEAASYYRRVLLIEPQNPVIHFNLGVALGNKGELKEAIEHFRQAIYLKPDYEEARRALKLALEIEKRQKY
jgi:tetratricopeptide (TPR) repeat protein